MQCVGTRFWNLFFMISETKWCLSSWMSSKKCNKVSSYSEVPRKGNPVPFFSFTHWSTPGLNQHTKKKGQHVSLHSPSPRFHPASISTAPVCDILWPWTSCNYFWMGYSKTVNKSPYRVKTMNHERISFFCKVVPNVSLASYYFWGAPFI